MMKDIVHNLIKDGQFVYAVTKDPVKFPTEVVEKYGRRHNIRRKIATQANELVREYVRDTLNLKGKHLKVVLVSQTDEKDIYKDAVGRCIKLDTHQDNHA